MTCKPPAAFAEATPLTALADVNRAAATRAAGSDLKDPALWVDPSKPDQSLILSTNKVAAPQGALCVFGLDRPNNVDVEDGFPLAGRRSPDRTVPAAVTRVHD
jgi:myo-inositol-hexaphosphate 3-phosphohydrolase